MRTLFFVLLAANLLVLARMVWFSPAPPPMGVSPVPAVPRLMLASEAPPPAAAATGGGGIAAVDSSGSACRSIGPFDDESEAARAAVAFSESGYDAAPRSEESRIAEGYWVSLPPQPTRQAETRLMARLARAGITDASILGEAASRRVSVGVFTELERAERRAGEVRRLGLTPDVTERLRIGTTWWVDLQLKSPQELAEAESFNRESQSELELKPCPASPPGEAVTASEAAGEPVG